MMARPPARDSDAMTALLRRLVAQVEAITGRLSMPVGKRWRIQEDPRNGNLVAVTPATGYSIVLGTPTGSECAQVVDCVEGALRPELEVDADRHIGVRVSADAGNVLTAGSDGGLYVAAPPAGYTRVFTSGAPVTIPDALCDGPGIAYSPITVAGISGNAPLALVIKVDITHTWPPQLIVELIDSAGGVHMLRDRFWDGEVGIHQTFVLDASAIPANGTWKLRVEDVDMGDHGTIDSWQMIFQG